MAITKKEITEALHRGVQAASENYCRWSGMTLEKAPEYLIVVEIARRLFGKLGDRECLRLEMPYRKVLAGAEIAKGRGAPLKAIKDGKKADLALLKNRDKPTCVIEVKRDPNYQALVRDLERLRDVVYACRSQRGVLKHGFLSIYRSGVDTESEVDAIEKFFKENRHRAQAKRPITRKLRYEKAASIVVEITAARDG